LLALWNLTVECILEMLACLDILLAEKFNYLSQCLTTNKKKRKERGFEFHVLAIQRIAR
jgi:hypothetical protein